MNGIGGDNTSGKGRRPIQTPPSAHLPLLQLIRRAAVPWEGDICVGSPRMKHGPKHREVKQEIMTGWGKGGCQEPLVSRGQRSEDVRKMRHQSGG